jgi:hypothetical protein
MKTSISLDKNSIFSSFSSFFSGERVEELAKKTRFLERSTSRLTGKNFLELNVCDFGETGSMSLTEKCDYLHENQAITISKQGLDERYNTHAVSFMKSCFKELFTSYCSSFINVENIDSSFSSIKVTDSTSFQLPADLASFYVSNGGSTSGSSIKIHHSYDLLKGQSLDFYITDGKENDVNYWKKETLSIEENELHLCDLGYYQLSRLENIASKKAFFISRYKTGTCIYQKDKEGNYIQLDLSKLLSSKEGDIEEVYIGKNKKLPIRLIIQPLNEETKQKRLKKLKQTVANTSKKRSTWQTSELKKLLCGYNIFITNVDKTRLESKQVQLLYTLRWQIELIFRIWKSVLHIDKIGKMNIFRFECYLYGKLMALLLSSQLQAQVKKTAQEEGKHAEFSEWKVAKYVKKK